MLKCSMWRAMELVGGEGRVDLNENKHLTEEQRVNLKEN